MSIMRSVLIVAVIAAGSAACGPDDDDEIGWAIVKVEITDGAALSSICIDSNCEEFEPDRAVRRGEFSAYVDPGSTYEVLRVGETRGNGASGDSPVRGCMLLRLGFDSGEFITNCDVPPEGN